MHFFLPSNRHSNCVFLRSSFEISSIRRSFTGLFPFIDTSLIEISFFDPSTDSLLLMIGSLVEISTTVPPIFDSSIGDLILSFHEENALFLPKTKIYKR
jgi:hypothetical protein